jgi:chlorite dismutase
MKPPLNPRLFSFIAGHEGQWVIQESCHIVGEALEKAPRLRVEAGYHEVESSHAKWVLRGATSNERYVTQAEKAKLVSKQEGLGRSHSTQAVMIPIKKNKEWWAMTQEERRRIFEERSHHTQIGLDYLPAIARRLHHCRDLTHAEPFDFITWFEFAPADADAFDRLLDALRKTEEWRYVEREAELRLVRG